MHENTIQTDTATYEQRPYEGIKCLLHIQVYLFSLFFVYFVSTQNVKLFAVQFEQIGLLQLFDFSDYESLCE